MWRHRLAVRLDLRKPSGLEIRVPFNSEIILFRRVLRRTAGVTLSDCSVHSGKGHVIPPATARPTVGHVKHLLFRLPFRALQ